MNRKIRIILVSMILSLTLHIGSAPLAEAQRFGLFPDRGSGSLPLVRHDLDLEVDHPLATVTLTQEFDNPHTFNLETTFYYPVPAGATVTGMALWVNGERREARMLERQKAREIYEGIVSQKRDPALVERLDDGTFRIRIFPVLARSRTRVELRFVQPVQHDESGRSFVVLHRPPGEAIDALRLGVRLNAPFPVGEVRLTGLRDSRRFVADSDGFRLPRPASTSRFERDIHLSYARRDAPALPAAVASLHARERLVVAEVPLANPRGTPRRLALLLDRSSSMRARWSEAARFANELLSRLGPSDRAAVVPFGLLPEGAVVLGSSQNAQIAVKGAGSERAEGGTAFVPAVTAAVEAGADHLVLLSDLGSRYHLGELEALLRIAADAPGVMVSVVTFPEAENRDAGRELARVTSGLYQELLSGADPAAAAAALAALPGRLLPRLTSGPGEVHLISRDSSGLLLALRVPESSTQAEVLLGPALSQAVRIPLPPVEEQVSGAAALFAAASISRLMERIKIEGEEPELRKAVIGLSMAHGVMSEYTALLATETDADYLRETSGQTWQRRTPGFGDDLPDPTFHSTPEPHEIVLLGLALLALIVARKRGWLEPRPLP